jgi:peptide/nickel transport system permease protein
VSAFDPTAAPSGVPPLAPRGDETATTTATLSQWQLIRLRFGKHKLAVISLFVLVNFYLMALFAEFLAPYDQDFKDYEYSWAPPMLPAFSFSEGLYINRVEQHVDPVTLKTFYMEHPEDRVPLDLFVKGEPYKLFGLIPLQTRFIGVSPDYLAAAPPDRPTPRWFLFGADRFGHDNLSRLIFGARISLSIGLVAISVAFVLGCLIGGISGYVSGAVDTFIQRVIEVFNSFPHLPMWIALAAVFPADWTPLQTYFAIMVLLSFLNWTGLARVVRGKILSLREEDYAVAARLLGASHGRIIFRHLLPGFTSHIIVTLTLSVPGMILGETALSFLGIGLRPPVVSWGVMLQECLNLQVIINYPWMLMPVLMIIVTVLAFNFMGDGLRDAADPYSSH